MFKPADKKSRINFNINYKFKDLLDIFSQAYMWVSYGKCVGGVSSCVFNIKEAKCQYFSIYQKCKTLTINKVS